MTRLNFCFLLLALLFPATVFSADKSLAPTPPMGWNSWDSYGRSINEQQVRATADWMAKTLKRYGWQYVVIDEGWYVTNPSADPKGYKFKISRDGYFLPDEDRYPSARNGAGFKPLADYVHSLGLKFGIHIIRGIPRQAVRDNVSINAKFHASDAAVQSDTCPWNDYNFGVSDNAAGQAYYDSMAKLYAQWGVDFVKADCIADHPYKPQEIRMLSDALEKTGRPILLSLSPGPTSPEHAEYVARYSEMWRISDDYWDHWGPWPGHDWSMSLHDQFANAAKWMKVPRVAGHWPDADMLPLGNLPHAGAGDPRKTRLTPDEQVSMLTLWSMFRSPLIMGGDLLSSDDWTTFLLTNADVIAIDQHSRDNRAVISTDRTAVWTARPQSGDDYYVAVFNLADDDQQLTYAWSDLRIPGVNYQLRELWSGTVTSATSLNVTLKPHACAVWRITPQ
jgi:alpha-galactosidase